MKKVLVRGILVVALILTATGMAGATVDLRMGGLKFKSYDWGVSTGYSGTVGKTYFEDATVPGYDPQNLDHLLFEHPSLTIVRPDDKGLKAGEDGWGLFEVTTIWDGVPNTTNTDINEDELYWVEGDNGRYLQGMYWGIQDKRVEILADDVIRIYSTGLQFSLYDVGVDGGKGTDYSPSDRVDLNLFPGWVDGSGDLQAAGQGVWSRFLGDADESGVNGQSLLYLDVAQGDWAAVLTPFWDITEPDIDGLFDTSQPVDLYQTWSIVGTNDEPWVNSEDAGRGYVIPEPTTMCLLSLGALSLLRRKRS